MQAKILIVDDEPDLEVLVAQKFRRQIREGLVHLLFAHDGAEALSFIESDRSIDVVLSDINMPRMDGLSLLGKLQEAEEKPSMVIVSAYGDMANIRTAMNRGAFDFLTKPIDFADLETTLAKTIRHAEMLREIRRRQLAAERAQAALSRYFSPNLAARLAVDDVCLDMGGQRREVASIFTDIEGFTHLVETMQPDPLGRLLNEYLAGMTDVVFRHEGTVAKIIGDALHILFGAPMDQPDHAARAVACALELDDFTQGFRAKLAAEGTELGATRIGLHAGPAIVGNFGGSRFFDYTAYGDTINIASRLEAANKQFGTRICVSAALAERADGFVGRPVGELVLRGRADPLPCLEPLRSSNNIVARTDGYMAAYRMLEEGDPRAIAAFATHLGEQPDDPLASFHLKRLLNGMSGVRISL